MSEKTFREICRGLAVFLWLLIAAVALLLIALEFPPASENPELAGALLGAAGTVFAGWIAWVAVEKQIGVAKRERTEAHAAAVQSAATDLHTASFGRFSPAAQTEKLLSAARAQLPAIDAMSIHVGTVVRLALNDADRANAFARDYANRENNSDAELLRIRFESQAKKAALRLRVVAHGVALAGQAYAEGRAFDPEGSVDRSIAVDACKELEASMDDLGHFEMWIRE